MVVTAIGVPLVEASVVVVEVVMVVPIVGLLGVVLTSVIVSTVVAVA